MKELRVTFEPFDGAYAAHIDGGEAVRFESFLKETDFEDVRWYLEEYMDLPDGGAVVRAKRVEKDLEKWGRQLYDAVFSTAANKKVLAGLIAGSDAKELTIATDIPDLLRIPWELMRDDAGPLAMRVSIRRQLATPEATEPRQAQLPLRILYIVSRPEDTGFIDPRFTARSLFDALDPLGANVRLDFCRPPTVERMEAMLRQAETAGDPYDIVHFDGHGTFMPHSAVGALCFEQPDAGSGDSRTDLVVADRMGTILATHKIPLAVLEACRSGTVSRNSLLGSVAPRLIAAGVDSVLSMGHAVHIEAARRLMKRFYEELVLGHTIGQAVAQARLTLVTMPVRFLEFGPQGKATELQDWFLPHLYQRAGDDALVPEKAAGKGSLKRYDLFLSYNQHDEHRAEALAKVLSNRHGLRVWFAPWNDSPGNLRQRCEDGIRQSRFTVPIASATSIESNWVRWEIDKHVELNGNESHLLPVKFDDLEMPADLNEVRWIDFADPAKDEDGAALLARLIRSKDAEDARAQRGYRSAAGRDETGAFPLPPRFGFHGRAKELYDLERRFQTHRGVVLHAMGGMGKTSLATEAANWWTRSGLFRDGACFISFEQFASAERVVQVLGGYIEGPSFDRAAYAEQRERVLEHFQTKEVLMVWDNFESTLAQFQDDAPDAASPYTDEERHLLSSLFHDLTHGPGKGCILVTCRPGQTGLAGAHKYELHGLARPDSLWLLSNILRQDDVSLEQRGLTRENLDPLLKDLADHPLSIELVGPHLRKLSPEAIRTDFAELIDQFSQDASEFRNTSLRASLEFSRRHLSPTGRAALAWLGLFQGGVFEQVFLDVSELKPEDWTPIFQELQAIALIRTEDDILIRDRPFLRFHPTLAAACDNSIADQHRVREQFVATYNALARALSQALQGSRPRIAMHVLSLEDANCRRAVRWALAGRQVGPAALLGEVFGTYLQVSGRPRERDAWVNMLRDAIGAGGFTEEAAQYEREQAWTRFRQGEPKGALKQLATLVQRLEQQCDFDPAFQLANTLTVLGRILHASGESGRSVQILQKAVSKWEILVEEAESKPWRSCLDEGHTFHKPARFDNLSASMSDLANALRGSGKYAEALMAAEQSLAIDLKRGSHRSAAAGHGQCAEILAALGRLDEADNRYVMALSMAKEAGDKELEGTFLQHRGTVALEQGQWPRAAILYAEALGLFQASSNIGGIMRTYNLLGLVERNQGRLPEARAWYEKSHDLAQRLNDQLSLGAAALNIGTVCRLEGDATAKHGHRSTAIERYRAARDSVKQSLNIDQSLGDEVGEAQSRNELARIHVRLGNLDEAEECALLALKIRERLGLTDAYKSYDTLCEIAAERNDEAAAREWAQKRDAMLTEVERRKSGTTLPSETLKVLKGLTIACAMAGFGGKPIGPNEQEALSTIEGWPPPLPEFATALRSLTAGQIPSVPESLPAELREILSDIIAQIRQAQGGG